jgi:hypothetical protein
VLEQHLAHRPGELLREIRQLGIGKRNHARRAMMLLLLTHHMWYLKRLCARTLGVWENMQARNGQRLHERIRVLEFLRRLATCTHDKVHPDKRMRHHFAYALDFVAEQRRIVMAPHKPQHLVRPALQRNMEMRHETFRMSHEIDNLVSEQIGLD